jgi:alcohol dehydrogenase (cytochrome c)
MMTTHDHSKAKRTRKGTLGIAAVVLILLVVISPAILKLNTSGRTWDSISWRVQIFTRKAEGKLPDLSWRELWFMTHVRGGFGMEGIVRNGFSLDGGVVNPFTTIDDRFSGARLFRERCAVCHGDQGTGGHAPRLNRSGLSHGDSDLAIYKVVRDGIPQTGMAPVATSPRDRWQIIGYLRALQSAASSQNIERLPPINISVSGEQILSAGTKPDQWLTFSGSLDGRRFAPLAEITPENVSRLRLRWIHQLGAIESRNESTPLVIGGTIFSTEPPSDVVALDAKSGEVRWRRTQSLPDRLPICCARSNRGLAILGNVLYLGSLDGYLVALNAANGNLIWQTAVAKPSEGFTITGAPLIVHGLVVVGVAGGEYGVRGFLAAYDPQTGRQQWKFNTIPGPGEFGHETWKNDAWESGGGPTWVTGSYDPSLDLIYWGVGNPSPAFTGDVRPGDNLFTDSVIALHASTGKLAWYFQFTPHDDHDWDSAQTPILAELQIKGALRRVICVANRNGFYYVLDRTSGEFLRGVPFVEQNWADGLDSAGRPILRLDAEVTNSGRLTRPGVGGGTNWQNGALDLKHGLIFIAATEGASVFTKSPNPKRGELGLYAGSTGGQSAQPEPIVRALDATTGARKWEHPSPDWRDSTGYGYGGLLATGSGLVFGESGGYAFALDSATGRELWSVYLGGDTYAPPITFNVDGHQVILVSAGRGVFAFGL